MIHKIKNRIPLAAVAALLLAIATSCFTGIESTPKITADDVKRENIPVRPEDSYLAAIKSQPLAEWKSGKKFYVTDPKFRLILQQEGKGADSLYHKEITYQSHREVTSIAGDNIVEIQFVSPAGHALVYRTSRSGNSIDKDGHLSIPFLVDMDIVGQVSGLLKGHEYYILTSSWYDRNMDGFRGRKFVPVKVENVRPGNGYYSAILDLIDEKGHPFAMYLSVADDNKSLRGFGSLFSFTNPRDKYPQILDATWKNIINGRVAEDMTRDECRLALGTPASVDRRIGYNSISEIWTYENGIYLIFEDDLLRTFRQ